jgi:hypothetical protein
MKGDRVAQWPRPFSQTCLQAVIVLILIQLLSCRCEEVDFIMVGVLPGKSSAGRAPEIPEHNHRNDRVPWKMSPVKKKAKI